VLHLNRFAGGLGAGAIIFLAASAQAQDTGQQTGATAFRFEGRLGAEYSSNVAVPELDVSTGQGDWAAAISGLIEASATPAGGLKLGAGYEFSQTLHDQFDAFDLTLHRAFAEAAYDFEVVTAGVLASFAQASLDGEDYLTLSQVSPYLSKSFGAAAFVRLAYVATDKSFEGRPERDATSAAVSADAQFLVGRAGDYVAINGRAVEEDASLAVFDFSGGSVRVGYVRRFPALDREMTLRAGVEYEQRDYDAPHPLISAPRRDTRTGVDASLEAPITKNVFVEGSYRFANSKSNLATADYDEHLSSLKLGVRY
jgi:hypothetical protein